MAAQGRDYRRRVWLICTSLVSIFPGVSMSWLRTISYRCVLFIHSVSQLAWSKGWARHHVKHNVDEWAKIPFALSELPVKQGEAKINRNRIQILSGLLFLSWRTAPTPCSDVSGTLTVFKRRYFECVLEALWLLSEDGWCCSRSSNAHFEHFISQSLFQSQVSHHSQVPRLSH